MKNKIFKWSNEKNLILKEQRGLSFEMVVFALKNEKLFDIIPSPTHQNQSCFVIEINNYIHIVPFVEESEDVLFLKTIYPSRKFTKYYLGAKNEK